MAGVRTWQPVGACAVLAALLAGCSTQPLVTSEERAQTPTVPPATEAPTTAVTPTTSTSTSTTTTTTSTTTSTTSTTSTSTTVPEEPANAAIAAFGTDALLSDIVELSGAPDVSCSSFSGEVPFVETDTDWRGITSFSLDVRERNINSLQPSAPSFSTSTAQVDIVNIGGLSTDFSWKPSSPNASDLGFPPAAADDLAGILDGLDFGPYEYSVGTIEGYTGISNPEVVREDLTEFFDRIATVDPALSEAGAAELELLSDEAIAEVSGSQIGVFHLFDNAFFTTTPESFDSLIPNLFGGEPVPAVGAVGVADGLDADDCVLLEFRLTADPASIDELLGDLADDPLVDPEELPSGDIVIESLVQAQYDPARGRIVRAVSRSIATIDLDSNVDIAVVTLTG